MSYSNRMQVSESLEDAIHHLSYWFEAFCFGWGHLLRTHIRGQNCSLLSIWRQVYRRTYIQIADCVRQVVSHDKQVLLLDSLPWLFLIDFGTLLQIPIFQPNYIVIQFLILNFNEHRNLSLLVFAIIKQFFNGNEVVQGSWTWFRKRRLLQVKCFEYGAKCATTNLFEYLIALSKRIKLIETSSLYSLCLLSYLQFSLGFLSCLLLHVLLPSIEQCHQIAVGLLIVFLALAVDLIFRFLFLNTVAPSRHSSQLSAIVEVWIIVVNFLILGHVDHGTGYLEPELRLWLLILVELQGSKKVSGGPLLVVELLIF